MHIHLLYPTGLATAAKLCHLATLQLRPQMYSDTDYANLYLVSPPVPALGACHYIEAEIRV